MDEFFFLTATVILYHLFVFHFFLFSDPLPKAAFFAYKARRNFLSLTQGSSLSSLLRQCDRAGRLLRESFKFSRTYDRAEIIKVSIFFAFCFSVSRLLFSLVSLLLCTRHSF